MTDKRFPEKIGKFVLQKKIGEGAFSYVYLAEEKRHHHNKKDQATDLKEKKKHSSHSHHKEETKYAVCKIMPRKQNVKKLTPARFDQEIKAQQLMHHPNIVQLIDIQKDSDYYYVFLEYCSGGDLFDYIYTRDKLSENQSAVFIKQILNGLKYIHSLNVAHCDLKPENILLDDSCIPKISDFGSAKILDRKGLINTSYGSPSYASPESLSGDPYDPKKSDIWACGVILYAMTTGLCPWSKKNGQIELNNQIKNGKYTIPSFLSHDCADLIQRLMTVDYKKRISIEEALNHPFLKHVKIPLTKFQFKYVSLRKIDHFLGIDRNNKIDKMIKNLSIQKNSDTDSKFDTNFVKVENNIQNDQNKTHKGDGKKLPPLPPKARSRKEAKKIEKRNNKTDIKNLPTRRSEQCNYKILY